MSGVEHSEDSAPAARVVVLDIGKTNLKLSLLDADGELLRECRRANAVLPGPPYPHFDLDGMWDWLLATLAALPERERIGSLMVTTHGASVVLLGDHGLALPMLDYEFAGVDEVAADYAALRDPFSHTLSPALPMGMNIGKQLYWLARAFPEGFRQARWIVPYPQYWGWRFSGVVAGELTSWGCHTDLWSPLTSSPSRLARRLGWQHLMPPLVPAGALLGPLLPEVAERTGLPAGCRVLSGIHDNNASMAKHLWATREGGQPPAPFSVISTGTWVLVCAIGSPLGVLDPARDMLANVDAWGQPVACARFMGGREFGHLNAGGAEIASVNDVAEVIAQGTLALPSFAELGGPYTGRVGRIAGPLPSSPAAQYALATLYCALLTEGCLARLQSSGDVIVEGPFTANPLFAPLLAALRPRQRVRVSSDLSGTTGGAYLLARRPAVWAQANRLAEPLGLAGLEAYRARWLAALGEPRD